jgi:mannose-6-phosphate isomerase-like protein (cupin superfamily)
MQLVIMSLKVKEDIGEEIHATHDQFFRVEKGKGCVTMGQTRINVSAGDVIMVPAGVSHNLTNTGKNRLRVITLYAPPNHADQLVQPTKAQLQKTANAAAMEMARKDMIDEGSPVITAPKVTGSK